MKTPFSVLAIAIAVCCAGCSAPNAGIRVSERLAARPPIVGPEDSPVDNYWKLVELNGKPAPHGSGGKEAHLLLQLDKPIARGFGGCNRFSARYELDGEKLSFHELVATRVACAEGMDLESEYFDALLRAVVWTRAGDQLTLEDADGRAVARFRMRPL